jgi:hypothetical protein
MTINDITTNRLKFDPKERGFVKRMHEDSKYFQLSIPKVGDKKALTYLVLIYDPNSEVRERFPNHNQMKTIAAQIAEFPTKTLPDGKVRFEDQYEDLMVGANKKFNAAVTHYIFKTFNIDFIEFVHLKFQYEKLMFESFSSFDATTNNLIKDVKKRLLEAEKAFFSGEEKSVELREALYEKAEDEKLNLMPEEVLDKFMEDGLKDWSPHGDYEQEDISYYGTHS